MGRSVKLHRADVARLAAAVLVLALGALLLGCSSFGGDQNTFAPEGDVARKQREVFFWALWPATAILVLVSGALVYALIRFRRRGEQEPLPKQVHGNTRLEIAWTIAPTVLLLILAVPMLAALIDLGGEAGEDALQVTVTGQRFSWVFEYPELLDADGAPLVTFGELHVPVEREIAVNLESVDVIHSFWVPKLAGKLDAIPGRTNRMKFTVDKPGTYAGPVTYSGQCAEFCGIGHSEMKFAVIAYSEADFQAWVEEQLAVESQAAAGQE